MSINTNTQRRLKAKAQQLKPAVRIGKRGLNQTVLSQVEHELDCHGLIKVKLLESVRETAEKKALATQLATSTNSVIIQQIGFIITLYKKTTPKKKTLLKQKKTTHPKRG